MVDWRWGLALLSLAAFLAVASPGSSLIGPPTFTVPEPQAGDSGLYSPAMILNDGDTVETEGMRFAFELGNWTVLEDAYGVERDVVPFHAYAVVEDRAFELPVTSWVHARAAPSLVQTTHLAPGMQGAWSGQGGFEFVQETTRFASAHQDLWGPECLFLTGVQGETVAEGATLPLENVCGQDLDRVADGREATVELTVAEIVRLEEGGTAARFLLTADAPEGSLELDLWYKDSIPYPVEKNLVARLDTSSFRDDDTNATQSPDAHGVLGELLGPMRAWFETDSAQASGNESDPIVFEASIELERFHRGQGVPVPPGSAPTWPSDHTRLEYSDETRWGPPGGGASFAYPHEDAVAAILQDPTLVEFQVWLEQNPEARALASAFTETVTENRRTHAWTFHVVGDDEEAWRVTTERTSEIRGPGEPLVGTPMPLTENEAETFDVDPDDVDLEGIPDELPTISSIVEAWERHDTETARQTQANLFTWVDQPLEPSQVPGLRAGWQDPGDGSLSDPFSWEFSKNRSLAEFHPGDGAMLDHERTRISMGSAWLGQGAGSQEPTWSGMEFMGASDQPAAMEAPVVLGVASVATITLVYLLLVKLGLAVPFYSRLSREELLENETRRSVYEAIGDDPGSSLKDLAERVDCSVSTVRYHLRRLEDETMVASVRLEGARRWFPAGLEKEEMRRQAVLDVGESRSVFEAIRAEPGSSLSEIADAVGSSPPAVHKILDRLIEAGLVEKHREGRRVALHPSSSRARSSPPSA